MFWVNATWKDTSTIKGKTARTVNHYVAPAASLPYVSTPYRLGSLPLTLPYTVLTYFNVERLILFSKMLERTNASKNIAYPAHIHWCRLQKRWFLTPAPILYACRCSLATLTHVCNVLLTDFVKKSWFECCFWSTQCTETQARTSDIVNIWVFFRPMYSDGVS